MLTADNGFGVFAGRLALAGRDCEIKAVAVAIAPDRSRVTNLKRCELVPSAQLSPHHNPYHADERGNGRHVQSCKGMLNALRLGNKAPGGGVVGMSSHAQSKECGGDGGI